MQLIVLHEVARLPNSDAMDSRLGPRTARLHEPGREHPNRWFDSPDFDNDGMVGITDLLIVLTNWGL